MYPIKLRQINNFRDILGTNLKRWHDEVIWLDTCVKMLKCTLSVYTN